MLAGQMLWGVARGVAKSATMPDPVVCEHDEDVWNGERGGNPKTFYITLRVFECDGSQ